MRILLLTPRVPWPPTDGGRIAMSRLAESLAHAGASVEVLSLNPRKHRVSAASPLPLEAVPIDTSRVIAPMLHALTSDAPFLVSRFLSRDFDAALRARLASVRPDVVQIESPFLLPYVKTVRAVSDARIALRSLNVEFRIWDGLAEREQSRVRRFALRRVAASLRRYEVRELNAPDAIVPISNADADDFRALGCTRPMHVAPCGITLDERAPESEPEAMTVGFIGSLDFRPNQDAVSWIVDELWPRVIRRVPEARLSIAGSHPPAWLRDRAQRESIAFLGSVDDASVFMRRMAVMIAPLFAGGGMRIKVLEAMALGKAVVATALGAGGIEVNAGREVLLAEDADAFADAVVRLLHDCDAARSVGAAARAMVAERYEAGTIGRGLLRFYESLC